MSEPPRFRIDQWDPAYGPSADGDDDVSVDVDIDVDVDSTRWHPVSPNGDEAWYPLVMIDGVRRLDAAIWIESSGGPVLGLCASVAAGRIRLDPGLALVDQIVVKRVLACTESVAPIRSRVGTYEPVRARDGSVESLSIAIQEAMARLEVALTATAVDHDGEGTAAPLVVVDGPLRRAHFEQTLASRGPSGHADSRPTILGYVKRHHTRYLPPRIMRGVMEMGAGRRSPVFRIDGRATRWSWYVSLDDDVGGLARVECDGRIELGDTRALADRSCAICNRFASQPFRDSRAPQNLSPIGAVERDARHRLGDARLVRRALSEVSAS